MGAAEIPRSGVPLDFGGHSASVLIDSYNGRELPHLACAVTPYRNYRILRFVRLRETHAIHPM
jgi:hypothetical protein